MRKSSYVRGSADVRSGSKRSGSRVAERRSSPSSGAISRSDSLPARARNFREESDSRSPTRGRRAGRLRCPWRRNVIGACTYRAVRVTPVIKNPWAYEGSVFRSLSVDLTTQYRFTNGSRWTPYLNAGIRLCELAGATHQTRDNPYQVIGGFGYRADRRSVEVGLGTT